MLRLVDFTHSHYANISHSTLRVNIMMESHSSYVAYPVGHNVQFIVMRHINSLDQ